MKFIGLILVSLSLFSCSSSKQEDTSSNDSTHVDSIASLQDTTTISNTSGITTTDEPVKDSVITAISNIFNEITLKFERDENQFYSASFSFSGYESGNQTNWYFDSLMTLKYCKGSWDMEGTGGRFTYYFEDENLVAAQIDDEGQESFESKIFYKGTEPIFGFNVAGGEEQDNDTTYLYDNSYSSTNTEALDQFQKLLTYFRENSKKVVVNDDGVIIEIENTVNYGQDFVQKESSYMSKALYQKLIKK